MKKFYTFLLLFITLISTTLLTAETDENTHPVIRVGFFEFDGYHKQDSDGTRSGYGYDFLQKLARYTNWSYEYIGYEKSWNDMQQMLADGKIDILTSAQKTPERETLFGFSHKAIGTSAAILTAKSGNEKFISGQYATYNGMRVGMLNGNSRNTKFEQFAKEHQFTYEPVYFDNTEEMIEALQNAETVDTLLTSNLRAIKNEWILNLFSPSDFYVMVRKGDTQLLSEINDAITQMDMYDSSWRDELWDTYYKADTGEQIAFSAKERAFIENAKMDALQFNAIVNPDRAPYSYFENGKAKGIIPELFKEIEKRTGITFNIVETKDRKEYWEKIKDKSIDVRIDTYANYYETELYGYKLTDPYITTSISCITDKSFTGTPRSIAALRYADRTIPYKKVTSSATHTAYFDSMNDCIRAVRNGSVDAAYIYTYTAQKIINDDIRNSLTSTIYPQFTVSFAVGVSSKADPCLLTVLNKAVNSIRSSYTEQIITEQTSTKHKEYTFLDYLVTHPIVAILFFAFIAFILLLFIAFIIHQRTMILLEKKNKELALAMEKADRASHAKSSFLSRMSHEMRTPMNAIVGITAIAKDHTHEPEKVTDYLSKIDSSSHLLLGIINDVLDMSAIENNKISIAHEPFSLKESFSAVATLYDVQCRNKGITFIFEDKADVDFVIGDQLRINQILLNLISNAYKFTEKTGSITLRITSTKQQTAASNNTTTNSPATVQFVVADTGCGMTEEMVSRLFQPFEQESADTAQKYGGSGLGLAITKHLVELMKGTITVSSKKLKGTTFTVTIPLEQDSSHSEKMTTLSSANAKQEHKIDFTNKRFLLAEDNELNREIAVELLKSVHAEIDTAVNGKMAVDLFNASSEGTYDLILMDMQMPVMNGVEATKQIRFLSHPQARTIPILAMTANAYTEDINACLSAGMNGHLAKPIEPELLYRTINSFFEKQ